MTYPIEVSVIGYAAHNNVKTFVGKILSSRSPSHKSPCREDLGRTNRRIHRARVKGSHFSSGFLKIVVKVKIKITKVGIA